MSKGGAFPLQTARLVIREADFSMAARFSELSLDEDNRRFLPDEVFETEAEAYGALEHLLPQYGRTDGPLVYPIFRVDGVMLGHVEAVPLAEGEWEIGYHIGQPYIRNGYASEALTAFLPVIGAQIHQKQFYGICVVENVASRRVLEKCGFHLVYEGLGPYQGRERPLCRYIWPHDNVGRSR